jgi:hypothetical protein
MYLCVFQVLDGQKTANPIFIKDKKQNNTQSPKNPGFDEAVSDIK